MDITSYKLASIFATLLSHMCVNINWQQCSNVPNNFMFPNMHGMTHTKWVLHLLFPCTICMADCNTIILYVPCPILSNNCMSRPRIIADPINGSISGLICGTDVLLSTTPVCIVRLYIIWQKKPWLYLPSLKFPKGILYWYSLGSCLLQYYYKKYGTIMGC